VDSVEHRAKLQKKISLCSDKIGTSFFACKSHAVGYGKMNDHNWHGCAAQLLRGESQNSLMCSQNCEIAASGPRAARRPARPGTTTDAVALFATAVAPL
jgi:hypothetical protein